jgi:hypothetical protein
MSVGVEFGSVGDDLSTKIEMGWWKISGQAVSSALHGLSVDLTKLVKLFCAQRYFSKSLGECEWAAVVPA